jgi:hypothetical protein
MIYDTEFVNDLLGGTLAKYWVSNITAETSLLWIVNLLSLDYIERPVKYTKRYSGQPFVWRGPKRLVS